MDFQINKSYFGFKVIEKQKLEDIDSMCFVFEHEKSGAKVFYAKNEDENKVFFVSFKTPPVDDCGTAHILEHSVLCGSKKYPTKDPFNELLKGSLNTYLNALTYSDKTMYPVASCNHEDFKKITDVYLDAVFNPMVLKEEKIFNQEGWHYELNDKEDDIVINGVVYNEMKGALSSPERVLYNAISHSLFPETIYRFESGGDPAAIPDLSYEKFTDFYNMYYHPSNSFFYLYGDMDIEYYLNHINEEYLSKYDRSETKIIIEEEKHHSGKVLVSDTFSVPVGTKTGNESLLSVNFLVGNSTDKLLALSMKILNYVLLETEASPLKKVLVEKRIAESVEGWFDSSTYQMIFSIVGKNSTCKKIGLYKETIFRTLEELANTGLNKDLLIAAVNKYEFMLKEADYGRRPKGLSYGMGMMKSWLHGQSPIQALKTREHIETLRDGIDNGYFEDLITKYFLKSYNTTIAAIAAEEGKQEREDEELKLKLSKMKMTMSEEEKEKLIQDTKALREYQNTPDSQEDIDKIPTLKKEDIDKKASFNEYEEMDSIVYLPQNTNGISHVRFLFSTESVPQDLVPYAGILARVLGKLDTKNLDTEKLSTQINKFTGGLTGYPIVFSTKKGYKPVIAVSAKALDQNTEPMFELLEEIIFKTNYESKNNLKNIMLNLKAEQEMFVMSSGHIIAISRCKAMLDEGGYYTELIDDLEYNDGLLNAINDIELTSQKLREAAKLIFTKENFTSILCSENIQFTKLKDSINNLASQLPSVMPARQNIINPFNISKEAVENGDKIVYNAKAANYFKAGIEYSGKMEVIKNIINREYLWKEVRVKGGAYGCGCNFDKSGKVYFYSYRDPNIKETFDNFDKVSAFLRDISLSEKELTKYTLGAINDIDKPESISTKIGVMMNRYFLGITKEDVQKSRDELLSVTEAYVRNFSELLIKIMECSVYTTFGNDVMIKKNKDIYDRIRPVNNK